MRYALLAQVAAVAILGALMGIAVEFWVLEDKQEWTPKWNPTIATVANNTEEAYRCCNTINCVCSEAPAGAANCSSLLDGLVEGVCGDGYYCCWEGCDTCKKRCWKKVCHSCDEHGSECCRKERRWCKYPCNCGCRESVADQKCDVACGTCWDFTIEFVYPIKESDELVYSTMTRHCKRDDFSCEDQTSEQFAVNNTMRLWYKIKDPEQIRLTDPDEAWEITGGMIAVLFFISLFAAIALCFCVAGCIDLYKKM